MKIAVVLRIKRQVITCLEIYSVKLACENLQLQQMLACWEVLGTFGYEFPLLEGSHSRGRVKCMKKLTFSMGKECCQMCPKESRVPWVKASILALNITNTVDVNCARQASPEA